ncbi:Uncharacterised protein [Neisseria meningitidis]|nr:Uncharacterised protein [Neisseria meningitidis]CWT75089.1 Uncharacterised protein [Neisseria meningitidis]
MFPVFRGGTHHSRAADVDVFNRVFQCAVWFGDGGGEGVEVDTHKVDVADTVFFHLGNVFVQIAPTQNTAVDFRMQRFHAAVEHFGEAGIVGDFNHGNARIGKQFRRAAGGEDFDTELVQSLGKFDRACLVGQADQGTFDDGHWASFSDSWMGKGELFRGGIIRYFQFFGSRFLQILLTIYKEMPSENLSDGICRHSFEAHFSRCSQCPRHADAQRQQQGQRRVGQF